MDAYLIRILADVYACNARIEAMKVANVTCEEFPKYKEDDFNGEAITLSHLSEALRNYG